MLDAIELAREVDTAVDGAFQRYPRVYLGFSSLADLCPRKAYLSWRFAKFERRSPRMQRLLDRGNREEERFVYWLRLAGYRVFDKDPLTNQQFEYVRHHGHVKGHCDAHIIVAGLKGVVEMKTHNNRSFSAVKKGNNIQFTKPEHYDQMQAYMDCEGADFGLYGAVNKDNDALHWEVHPPDKEAAQRIEERALHLLTTTVVPKGISDDSSFWKCNMCLFKDVCFFGEQVNKTCRMCEHSQLGKQGSWKCTSTKKARKLTLNDQLKGCPSYVCISGL